MPPNSAESEMAVLGCCLLSQNAVKKCFGILEPSDFFQVTHREIWEVIQAMHGNGEAVDLVTVRNELIELGLIEKVGGVGYLVRLTNEVPSTVAAPDYARIVKEKSARRRLIIGLSDAHERAESGDLAEVADSVALLARRVIPDTGSTDDVWRIADRLASEPAAAFMPTGCQMIDLLTGHHNLNGLHEGFGIPRGEVTLIGAPSGHGKTIMLCQIATSLASIGKRGVFLSLEMSGAQIAGRMMRQLTGLTCEGEDSERWAWGLDTLMKSRMELRDSSREMKDVSVQSALDWIDECHEREPIEWALIDYFGKMQMPGKGEAYDRFVRGSEALRRWSKASGIPLITATQINVDAKSKTISPKGGRVLEDDCGIFANIIRENTPDGVQRWLRVTKNRHGDTPHKKIRLDGRTLTFMEQS